MNAGFNTVPSSAFDQRGTGFARSVGATDIGAFELQTPLPTPVITVTGLSDATKGAVYLAGGTTAVTLNQSLTTAQLAGLVFKPVANANGSAGTFSYSVTDGTNTQSQTITLNITPVNDAPVATNDSFITREDTVLTGNVIINTDPNGADSDPENNPLTIATVNGSAANVGTPISLTKGSLRLNADGSFTYTPNANANGSDSFTYTLSDGTTTSNTATVSLTINPVNDTPVVANPLTNQASPEDTAVNFTIPANTFSDVDNPTLTLSASLANDTALPAWLSFNAATGTFSGTPPLNFNGTLPLKVTASDGQFSTASTFDLVITPVNDAPIATNDSFITREDTLIVGNVIVNTNPNGADSDAENNPLTIATVNGSAANVGTTISLTRGSLKLNADGSFTYTPNVNANGSDSFTYTLSDGTDSSNTATVSLTITAVNDAPALTGTPATLPAGTEDTPYIITTANLLAGFTDVDSPSLSVTNVQVNGVALTTNAAGDYVFNPPLNANGAFTVTYNVSDGQASVPASLNFTLAAVNDAPTIAAPTSVRVQSGGTAISGISIADVDAGTGTLTTTLSVTNGSLNLTNLNGATATGLNTGSVTLTGTLTQINAALATLRYSGSTFSGNTNLTVRVNDNGNVGSGGAKTTTQTIALQVARDLGNLSKKEIEVQGTVSSSDPVDRYQFTLTQATTKFKLTLGDLAANADVYILNSNGTVVASSTNAGNRSEVLNNLSLLAGTYFIEVRQVSGNTKYELEVEAL